jgi:hypothetical protein
VAEEHLVAGQQVLKPMGLRQGEIQHPLH